MPTPPLTFNRAWTVVPALIVLAGCGSSRGIGPRGLGTIGLATTLRPAESTARAVPLRALPARGTFAWVVPSEMFAGLRPEENEALGAELAELREGADAVLRANGWREVAPDSALFRLVLARTARERQVETLRPDPRNDRIVEKPCENTRSGQACATPVVQRYPPIRDVQLVQEVKVGYAIRRVSDGATAWWILIPIQEKAAVDHVARVTVELLLVEEK